MKQDEWNRIDELTTRVSELESALEVSVKQTSDIIQIMKAMDEKIDQLSTKSKGQRMTEARGKWVFTRKPN